MIFGPRVRVVGFVPMTVLAGLRVVAIATALLDAQPPGPRAELPISEQNEIVRTRCAVCHTDAKPLGGLSLAHFDARRPDPALARMMLVKIKDDGAMTASGSPMPPADSYRAFVDALASYASRTPADPRWTVDLATDPATPKRGHSVVTARADLPSGTVVLTCNGATRQALVTMSGKSGDTSGAVDFDGLSPVVRAIFSWCLTKDVAR